jgi:hypothetical protein
LKDPRIIKRHSYKNTLSKLLALALSAASIPAAAGAAQTSGTGPAFQYPAQYSANFAGNTTPSNNYSEGGLLFSDVGSGNNGGCGFAAVDCEASPGDNFSAAFGAAFSWNYMGTDGFGADISIKSTLLDLTAIEFAVDSGDARRHACRFMPTSLKLFRIARNCQLASFRHLERKKG